jgi:glycosyltransferase involved in cell wall biosynthesis
MSTDPSKPRRIAIAFAHLRHLYGEGGGLERNRWNLAMEFLERGHTVDLLVFNPDGLEHLPERPRLNAHKLTRQGPIISRWNALKGAQKHWKKLLLPVLLPLKGAKPLRSIDDIRTYIDTHHPDDLIGGGTQENLALLLARSGAHHRPRLVASEHNPLSNTFSVAKHRRPWRWKHLRPLLRQMYMDADKIVGISGAVANDVADTLQIPKSRIDVIYNPVINADLHQRLREPVEHPWLAPGNPPVVLNVGRLTAQKDHATLLRAFQIARRTRPLRLIILGDGPERTNLEALAKQLDIHTDVHMPGFESNPLRFMVNANVFALTSRWEGFGNVLVEALAAGCPIVATDCPGGPAEILDYGRYGTLTPSSPTHVANALLSSIEQPPNRATLRARAELFTADRAATKYLAP